MLTVRNTDVKKPGAGPGRPRQFVPEAALQRALELFWRKGYAATSVDDLLSAMSLSKSSFYACFGSRQALYNEAIRAYSDSYFDALCTASRAAPGPQAGVLAVLAMIADTEGGPQGCFFINTVIELAPHDPDLTTFCQSHIARVAKLVTGLLVQAGFKPQLASDRADAALALAIGLITLRKAGLPSQRLEELLGQVRQLLVLP